MALILLIPDTTPATRLGHGVDNYFDVSLHRRWLRGFKLVLQPQPEHPWRGEWKVVVRLRRVLGGFKVVEPPTLWTYDAHLLAHLEPDCATALRLVELWLMEPNQHRNLWQLLEAERQQQPTEQQLSQPDDPPDETVVIQEATG